jgi:hypothetical protein
MNETAHDIWCRALDESWFAKQENRKPHDIYVTLEEKQMILDWMHDIGSWPTSTAQAEGFYLFGVHFHVLP